MSLLLRCDAFDDSTGEENISMKTKDTLRARITVYRLIIALVMLGMVLPLDAVMNTPTAYAWYGPWQVGQRVGLKLGAEIRAGSSFSFTPYPQRVPEDDWQVVLTEKRVGEGQTWWNIDRKAAGDPSGGTGWVYFAQASYNICRPGNIYVASGFELEPEPKHAWPPKEGDKLTGRFTLGNNGDQSVHIERYGIRMRRNYDPNDYLDFLSLDGVSANLGPGQTVRFDQTNNQSLPAGHYRAEITWMVGGVWYIDSASARDFDVRPSQPGRLELIDNLSLQSDGSGSWPPRVGDKLVAHIKVRNDGDQPLHIEKIGVRGRRNGSEYWDIGFWTIDLSGGQEWTLSPNNQRPLQEGAYSFRISYSLDGTAWNEIGDQITFTVGSSTYSISGRVTNPSNTPILGVTISDGAGNNAITDSNGNYSFHGLVARNYTLTASKSGYSFSTSSRTVTLPPSATRRDFVGTPITIGGGSTPTEPPTCSHPPSDDRTFVSSSCSSGSTGQTTRTINVPVRRYFARGKDMPATVVVSVKARSSKAGPARVFLNDRFIGTIEVNTTWGSPKSLKCPLTTTCSSTDFKTPDAYGSAESYPAAKNNAVRLEHPDGIDVDLVSIRVEGDLRPLVFVHGWTGDKTSFRSFSNLAQSEGIAYLDPMNLGYGVESDEWTINALAESVDEARIKFGVDKVNLIAHSRGGVISRLGLGKGENLGPLSSKIDGLVSISSPHHGTDLIYATTFRQCRPPKDYSLSKCQEVAKSLMVEPMREKNYGPNCHSIVSSGSIVWPTCVKQFLQQEKMAGTVNFRALSSDWLDIGYPSATYPWLNSCNSRPYPNGYRLDGEYGRDRYNHQDINTKDKVYDRSIELLRAGRDASRKLYDCPLRVAANTSTIEATERITDTGINILTTSTEEYRMVQQSFGALPPGASTTANVALVGGEDTQIKFQSGTTASMNLRSPSGLLVTPASLPPGVTFEQHDDTDTGRIAVYTVTAAETGNWQVLINNTSSTTEAYYALSVETKSPIMLSAATDALSYSIAAPVMLRARLTTDTTSVTAGVTMNVTVNDGDQQYIMRDDGAGGDRTAGDGEFAVQLSGFSTATYQALKVQANWEGGQRQQTVVVTVLDQQAKVTAVGNGTSVDKSADGRWQGIIFPVTIEADNSGVLTLSGQLLADDNTTLAGVNQLVNVVPGRQTINLRFDGTPIHGARRDGSYHINDLTLEGTINGTLTYHRSWLGAATVQSYSWKDFNGEPLRLTVTNNASVKASLSASSAQLVLTGILDVDYPGTYAWTGDLYTQDGRRVASSAPSSQTLNGKGTVGFTFESSDILASGLSGPYELRNVSVWQVGSTLVRFFGTTEALTTYDPSMTSRNTIFLPLTQR